jgi:hypothetical protein
MMAQVAASKKGPKKVQNDESKLIAEPKNIKPGEKKVCAPAYYHVCFGGRECIFTDCLNV